MPFAKHTRFFLAICSILLLGSLSACKQSDDLRKVSRVYFTYKVVYTDTTTHPDGTTRSECVEGDGMCDFEVRKAGWRPSGALAEGQGFGYMTVTSSMKLRMVVYMPFMSTATYREHYADGLCTIPGTWKVAAELLTGIGLNDGLSISMGDYSAGLGTEDGYEVLIITYG